MRPALPLVFLLLAGCISGGSGDDPAAGDEVVAEDAQAAAPEGATDEPRTARVTSVAYAQCLSMTAQVPIDQREADGHMPDGWRASSWLAGEDRIFANMGVVAIDCADVVVGGVSLGPGGSMWAYFISQAPEGASPDEFPLYGLASLHSHDEVAAYWLDAGVDAEVGEVSVTYTQESAVAMAEAAGSSPSIDWHVQLAGVFATGRGDIDSWMHAGPEGATAFHLHVDYVPTILGGGAFLQDRGPLPFAAGQPVTAAASNTFSFGNTQEVVIRSA